MTDALRSLRALGLFADVDDETLQRLLRTASEVAFAPGAPIVQEGDPGDALYVVLEGAVEVFKRRPGGEPLVLARCGAGECFGEQALMPGRPGLRTASVRALGPARLCRIERAPFQDLLAAHHPLKERLLRVGDRQLLENLAAESRLFRSFRVGSDDFEERRYGAGEVVFRQGDPADGLYLVLEGTVAIHREVGGERALLATLGAGQCFGEVALTEAPSRTATATAAADCRLLLVPAARYRAALAQSAELADLFRTLRRVYRLPRRGRLVQSAGAFLGRDAVTSLYELDDGRRVVVSRVVGDEIYNADEVFGPGAEPAITRLVHVDEGRQIRRELRLAGQRLVGLTVHGPWELVAELQGRLLEGLPLAPRLYPRFEATGRLGFEDTTMLGGLLCTCVQVERRAVKAAIRAGATRLVALQEQLGCGTVCGGCLPRMRQLLGDEQWAPVRIVDDRPLGGDVRRFRLRPIDRPMTPALPGQHVVLSGLVSGEWVRRPYTLTSAGNEPDHYEILVKREPRGVFSGWLFETAGEDALLRISPPQGDYYWRPDGAPAVCLVAGIGVTPALAMLRSRRREGWSEPLHVDLSVRREADLVCLDEAAGADPGVSVAWRVTGTHGRIGRADVDALRARFPDATYFLCGPGGYMDAVRAMLLRSGVEAAKIRTERFDPAPRNAPAPAAQAAPGRERGWMGLVRSLLRRM